MLPCDPVISPLSEPVFLQTEVPGADWAIFTSETAIHSLGGRRPAPRAWCVGDRTAKAAQAAGFDARSASGDADRLVAAMLAAAEPGSYLHLRGREARGSVAARLRKGGLRCAEAVIYEMQPRPLNEAALRLLAGDAPVIVPLFSPAAARAFGSAAKGCRAPLHLACLSPAVAAAASDAAEVRIAACPDAPAMLALIDEMQKP